MFLVTEGCDDMHIQYSIRTTVGIESSSSNGKFPGREKSKEVEVPTRENK